MDYAQYSAGLQLGGGTTTYYNHTSWEGDVTFPSSSYPLDPMMAETDAFGVGYTEYDHHTGDSDSDQLTTKRSGSSTSRSDRGTMSPDGTSPDRTFSQEQEDAAASHKQAPKRRRRKRPLTEEQVEKRREQNRLSQKNYRQRKDARITELEEELRATTQQNEHLEQLIFALRNQISTSSSSPLSATSPSGLETAAPLDEQQLYDLVWSPQDMEADGYGLGFDAFDMSGTGRGSF